MIERTKPLLDTYKEVEEGGEGVDTAIRKLDAEFTNVIGGVNLLGGSLTTVQEKLVELEKVDISKYALKVEVPKIVAGRGIEVNVTGQEHKIGVKLPMASVESADPGLMTQGDMRVLETVRNQGEAAEQHVGNYGIHVPEYSVDIDQGKTLTVTENGAVWKELPEIKGPKGETGEPGAEGPMGLQGPKGDKGDAGDAGLVGPQGAKGEPGEKGEIGPMGPQGPKGEAGTGGSGALNVRGDYSDAEVYQKGDLVSFVGHLYSALSDGLQEKEPSGIASSNEFWMYFSIQGMQGDKGETGMQGPQGEVGERGEEGPQGTAGERGEQGETGPVGPQGEKGEQGLKGDTGERGEQGPQGEQGLKGDTGERGENGVRPVLEMGEVVTLEPGSSVTAEVIDTGSAWKLNLGIPSGAAGAITAKSVPYTFAASRWSPFDLAISSSSLGVSINANSLIMMVPATDMTAAQYDQLAVARIICTSQTSSRLTFTCLGIQPTLDIPVLFIVQEVE